MCNTSLPIEGSKKQEEEEEEQVTGAVDSPQMPEEGCVSPTVAPVPSEGEPQPATHTQCQTWLLDVLDDVRYLISCTNWY